MTGMKLPDEPTQVNTRTLQRLVQNSLMGLPSQEKNMAMINLKFPDGPSQSRRNHGNDQSELMGLPSTDNEGRPSAQLHEHGHFL